MAKFHDTLEDAGTLLASDMQGQYLEYLLNTFMKKKPIPIQVQIHNSHYQWSLTTTSLENALCIIDDLKNQTPSVFLKWFNYDGHV